MPKRNREKLMEQSLYDLLCDMNASFMNGNPHCVLEAIKGENMICKQYCAACGARMDATDTNVGGKGGDENA